MYAKLWASTLVGIITASCCQAQELSYEDRIDALAYGDVPQNGHSAGTVELNITEFAGTDLLPHLQEVISGHTLDNLEVLSTITDLAKTAVSKKQWGDVVFLYNAFALNGHAEYVNATSKQMHQGLLEAVSGNNDVPDAGLIALYAGTSSSPRLEASFNSIQAYNANAGHEKRESAPAVGYDENVLNKNDGTCSTSHRAPVEACLNLRDELMNNHTILAGGTSRDICKKGCCISWSQDATFDLSILVNSVEWCVKECQSNKDDVDSEVSCRDTDKDLGGVQMTQCLSNRYFGCR